MTTLSYAAVAEALGPEVQVTHFLPGRIRLKLKDLKRNPEFAEEIEETLAEVPGIEQVEANPVTGSVLIEYDPEGPVAFPALVAAAKRLGILPARMDPSQVLALLTSPLPAAEKKHHERPYQIVDRGFHRLNEKVYHLTGGTADLRDLIPLGLLGLALSGMLRGKRATRLTWFPLLWYAFQSFRTFHPGMFAGEPTAIDDKGVALAASELADLAADDGGDAFD